MRIERLVLQDFRNYSSETIDLAPGLNLVIGANAQGKTNLLEAIYCIGGMGSPRGSDAVLVREGAERAVLHALVVRGPRRVEVDLEFRPGRGMRALINKTPVRGTRPLRELVVGVFFGPDELSLVKGPPDGRRRFADELVVKLRPAQEALRRDFERVLKQRNALLRSAPRGPGSGPAVRSALEVWDEALARSGAALAGARIAALGLLAPYLRKRYEEIAGSGLVELAYSSKWLDERACRDALAQPDTISAARLQAALAARIQEVREREIERGQSLAGPQRDDIVLELGSESGAMLDARTYASQGDQRTCALALKLAEHDLLSAALGDEPILLLDDVFSELDPRRRAWLSGAVRSVEQTVLSSAEPGAPESAGAARVIEVASGRVSA